MGTYATVPETLKKFYDVEYLYNMLPLAVVGDTLGVLYGRRRNLKPLRQLYREPDAAWRDMFSRSVEISLASGVRDLLYQRVAVSRTRKREPITLAPVSLECVGDGQGDKSVANAYRAIGGLTSRFFTVRASRKLIEHLEMCGVSEVHIWVWSGNVAAQISDGERVRTLVHSPTETRNGLWDLATEPKG